MRQSSNRETRKLLMERSRVGRIGANLPALDVTPQPLPDEGLIRKELDLPEVTEPEVVRYFTNLSQLNFSIDTNFYPLGSCSMKYNPKVNDQLASLKGFASIHPLQPEETVQGALHLLYNLQAHLSEITGMTGTSLSPMAGAHGELCGMLMFRAYHSSCERPDRKKIVIPDSAHGTNPASAAMVGYNVESVPSDSNGNMDLKALEDAATPDLAGLMITLPSTLGLFDTDILKICEIVHSAGGLVYGDGANMNALLGRVKLEQLGFDVVHLNLHKTFSTPHGGGGPGAGPVCVNDRLLSFLPSPVVDRREVGDQHEFSLVSPANTIGKIGGFHGNFGVLVRAYSYLRSLGADGLKEVSGNAVLNANYLLERLNDVYHSPYDRHCMHEVVFSARLQKIRGVKGLDIAKRLLDYGIHAPTMYFPLIVDEALMIEPTETETKEVLDSFVEAMRKIDREVTEDPGKVKNAPHTTPVSRLDEARAARQPDLRWKRKDE